MASDFIVEYPFFPCSGFLWIIPLLVSPPVYNDSKYFFNPRAHMLPMLWRELALALVVIFILCLLAIATVMCLTYILTSSASLARELVLMRCSISIIDLNFLAT